MSLFELILVISAIIYCLCTVINLSIITFNDEKYEKFNERTQLIFIFCPIINLMFVIKCIIRNKKELYRNFKIAINYLWKD